MPFINRVTRRSTGPADNVLIVEGGIPGWKEALERAKAEHRARQERLQEQGRAPRGRFVRRVAAAHEDDADSAGSRIHTVLGGLPDWRHQDKNLADARTEYESMTDEQRAERTRMHDSKPEGD